MRRRRQAELDENGVTTTSSIATFVAGPAKVARGLWPGKRKRKKKRKSKRSKGQFRIPREASFRITRKEETGVYWCSLLHTAHIDARFSQALHGHKTDHGARPFIPCCATTGAAKTLQAPGCQISLFGAPFSG